MSTVAWVALTVSLVVALVATFVVVLVWLVRKVQRLKAAARVEIEHDVLRDRPAKRFDDRVTFLGVESDGATQMRGNGTLALSEDELAFVLWLPHRLLRIPLRDIVVVDTAKSHLGKSLATPLLRVRWRTAGVEDTVAWRVVDLSGWLADLGSTTGSQPHV